VNAAREGTLVVPGARLYWRERGTGTPLIVLHGGPGLSHDYLVPEIDLLATACRLVVYDQRGRGRSSGGVAAEDVSLESELEDLDRVRRSLEVPSVALLGHSWGGLLALEYVARWPEHVSHLVLVNSPPATHTGFSESLSARRAEQPELLARMREIANDPRYAEGDIELEAALLRLHFSTAVRDPTLVDEVVRRMLRDVAPADLIRMRSIDVRLADATWRRADYDVLARLGPQMPPTLVIHGDSDLFPLAAARAIADRVAGAKLEVLAECGHFAYLERPEVVLDLVRATLASGDVH
jgi:proline iminopeptidase